MILFPRADQVTGACAKKIVDPDHHIKLKSICRLGRLQRVSYLAAETISLALHFVDADCRDGATMITDQTSTSRERGCFDTNSFRSFIVIRGETEVLSYHQALCDLAERCGQLGAMNYLPFFLSACRAGFKVPYLLVLAGAHGELKAAVLFYEYGIGRVSTGIFVPADHCGDRSVLAAEALRARVACGAIEFLLVEERTLFSLRRGIPLQLVGREEYRSLRESQPELLQQGVVLCFALSLWHVAMRLPWPASALIHGGIYDITAD